MASSTLTAARLRELLDYDPETGVFSWRQTRGSTMAGSAAGSLSESGYIRVTIEGRRHRAHRLVWLWSTGSWPTDQIDHRDGNRSNNRIENLRVATDSLNSENLRAAKSHNKCGLLGVYWHRRNKWIARITVKGKAITLGTGFETPQAAHAAYMKAKREMHAGCTI